MGLYLCIFEDEDEIDGVEVGGYADFGALREYVTRELEGGRLGASNGLTPKNAFESFIDVNGQFLLDRMQALAKLSVERDLPILFQ